MKVAVIGGGVAGMAVAQGLAPTDDVTLFEARSRLGGHADTHNLFVDGRSYAIDSGFIAFNAENYPQFAGWLDTLGVPAQPTSMSFGVSFESQISTERRVSPLTYGTSDLRALFSSRRNIVNTRFLRMLLDISRFYREARKLNELHHAASLPSATLSLGDYLAQRRYSDAFINDHLLPLCVALWSTTVERARDLPLAQVLAFMDSHKLLQFDDRPDWLVVEGGSNRYIAAFVAAFEGQLRLAEPVVRVERNPGAVRITTEGGQERFDRVVFACHADQALRMIDASPLERDILGAFSYDSHRAVVHSDSSFMPRNRRSWSSWNVVGDNRTDIQMTCWLNRVQSIESQRDFFVTLDPCRVPNQVWAERQYQRPVFNLETQRAQTRRDEISGSNLSYFAGAYWGFGTHEDGYVSGMDVISQLGLVPRIAASA